APHAERVHAWLRNAEDFVAMEIVTYVSQFFVHLRNLATFVVVGLILLLLTLTSYTFQPQRLFMMLLSTLMFGAAIGSLIVFVQINRNELVSRISGTTPNRFTPDMKFFSSVVTYVVPLLGLMAAQFADASDLLSAWVAPILRVFK